jgi:co-chaperonin GroES (HSP10)
MIKVVGHRVLLKLEKLEDIDPTYARMHKAGLIRAETEDIRRAEAGLDRGTVVEIAGEAFKQYHVNLYGNLDNFQPWCNVGDTVAFAKYSGKMIEDPETMQKYVVCNDEDIVCVLSGGNK